MSRQRLSDLGDAPNIAFSAVGSDLSVEGWERQELEADGDSVRIERAQASITMTCASQLAVRVPRAATLTIASVAGGLILRNLSGAVKVYLVGGRTVMENIAGRVSFPAPQEASGPLRRGRRPDPVESLADGATRSAAAEPTTRRVELHPSRTEKRMRDPERKLGRLHDATDLARWKRGPNARGLPARESSQRISDDERSLVLKMLHERKITASQADRLLGALEGEPLDSSTAALPPAAAGS